jgi:FMN reductase
LAVEVHLRPVLVELGATLPTRGLYVTEAELPESHARIDDWLHTAGPQLRHALSSHHTVPAPPS